MSQTEPTGKNFPREADPAAGLGKALDQLEHCLAQAAMDAPSAREHIEAIRREVAQLRAGPAADGAGGNAFSSFLQTEGEREKAALARELHDTLGGILTPAKMDLAWLEARLGQQAEFAERLKRLNALIDHGIEFKRRIIEKLRPSLLDHLGLGPALEWLVEEVCAEAGLKRRVRVSDRVGRLTPDLEIAVYRLAQEAMKNAVRHAEASCIELELERTEDTLRLVVSDDGVGIADLSTARQANGGIDAMNYRARSIDGRVQITSGARKGTRVEVVVPVRAG